MRVTSRSGCSTSYKHQNESQKFLKREESLLQIYYTLCHHQKSGWKVRIYANEKPTFLKHSKGYDYFRFTIEFSQIWGS